MVFVLFGQPLTRRFITSIAMCETIWVLSRAYGQPREKLVQVIEWIAWSTCMQEAVSLGEAAELLQS